MKKHFLSYLVLCSVALLMGACSETPDHARYIPKDAVAISGLNMKALTKKVAWNVITGSKIFKEWMKDVPDRDKLTQELDKSGVNINNTFYLYVKGNKQSLSGNVTTLLLPLDDAAKMEVYLKKTFPAASITQKNNRREAKLAEGTFAGWDDKLLIIINMLPDINVPGNTANNTGATPRLSADVVLSTEMENAFSVTRDNSILENKHFTALQTDNHDVLVWVNYDQLLSKYLAGDLSNMMGGFTLSNILYKDAAFAGGFDFEEGSIKGDIRFYTSDELKDVVKELGATNASKDMVEKLSGSNLDALMAMHLSPKGTKALLEKLGLLGLANIGLSQQGMSADYVFEAITGDMALSVNNFSLEKTVTPADIANGETMPFISYKPLLKALFILKVNKKENFNKLMQMVTSSGMMPIGNNTYAMPLGETDTLFIMYNDKYAVAGNNMAYAASYLNGTLDGGKIPAHAHASSHPYTMYIDVKELLSTINPSIVSTKHDSILIVEGKKLLDNIVVNGGEYKEDHVEYKMAINFINKKENSLLELMDFGMKVNMK